MATGEAGYEGGDTVGHEVGHEVGNATGHDAGDGVDYKVGYEVDYAAGRDDAPGQAEPRSESKEQAEGRAEEPRADGTGDASGASPMNVDVQMGQREGEGEVEAIYDTDNIFPEESFASPDCLHEPQPLERNKSQDYAIGAITREYRNLLLVGIACSGKTMLLRRCKHLIEEDARVTGEAGKRVVIVNCRTQNVHRMPHTETIETLLEFSAACDASSAFGGVQYGISTEEWLQTHSHGELTAICTARKALMERLATIKYLFFDDFHFLSSDMWQALEAIFRAANGGGAEPFGGINVSATADFAVVACEKNRSAIIPADWSRILRRNPLGTETKWIHYLDAVVTASSSNYFYILDRLWRPIEFDNRKFIAYVAATDMDMRNFQRDFEGSAAYCGMDPGTVTLNRDIIRATFRLEHSIDRIPLNPRADFRTSVHSGSGERMHWPPVHVFGSRALAAAASEERWKRHRAPSSVVRVHFVSWIDNGRDPERPDAELALRDISMPRPMEITYAQGSAVVFIASPKGRNYRYGDYGVVEGWKTDTQEPMVRVVRWSTDDQVWRADAEATRVVDCRWRNRFGTNPVDCFVRGTPFIPADELSISEFVKFNVPVVVMDFRVHGRPLQVLDDDASSSARRSAFRQGSVYSVISQMHPSSLLVLVGTPTSVYHGMEPADTYWKWTEA